MVLLFFPPASLFYSYNNLNAVGVAVRSKKLKRTFAHRNGLAAHGILFLIMVIFDGEKLCVSLGVGMNWRGVLALAAQYGGEVYGESYVAFPATKRVAREIAALGVWFDCSARCFLSDIKKIKLPGELYPFQTEGVRTMLSHVSENVLLADDQGLGKTVQAAVYLANEKDAFPAVVVCPASLKLNWAREIEKWCGKKCYVMSGKEPQYLSNEFLEKYPVWIINYDVLGYENKKEKKLVKQAREEARAKGIKMRKQVLDVHGWCEFLSNFAFKTVICDEVQYLGDVGAIRTRAVQKLCDGLVGSRKVFISGTPYETRTAQFYTTLHIISPKDFPEYYPFLYRYCDPKRNYFGWEFKGLSNAEELREKISRFMIRRLKDDVLTQLPPKTRSVIPLEISKKEREEYDSLETEFDAMLERGEIENKLVKFSAMKKAAFKAKKAAALRFIKEYVEANGKVVVFVYHKIAFEAVMETFGAKAVGINGQVAPNERQGIVDRFQNDEKIMVFVGQIKAAGVGLTLTSSAATVFCEFGSTAPQHEQAEDRVHRIGQCASNVFAYYLVMENSVDEDAMKTLEMRNKDIKLVMNGEEDATMFYGTDFTEATIAMYKKRRNVVEKRRRKK